ncbi:MAG: radical SAM protein, partial [Candidatus Aminicenantales bacterium]
MVEAVLYDRISSTTVRCRICQRRCVIEEGARGYCRTRINRKGTLTSLIYGRVSTIMISPIEKKPVYHFYPGSEWLSVGSLGCNFHCPGCQNWEIAHSQVREETRAVRFLSPDELVRIARENRCFGISWTYNEPTLWLEYTLEGAKRAKENGL